VRSKKTVRYVRVSRVGGRGGETLPLPPVLQRQSIEFVYQPEGL
jgi:hypothetical protein